MRKQSTTKQTIKRSDVRRLFTIIENSQSPEATDWIWESVSELTANAPSLDWLNDPNIFTRSVSEVLGIIEENRASKKDDDYQRIKMILDRIAAGETLEAIYQEDEEKRRAWQAERLEAERSKPEPKNWLSQEWRHWKLRQLERGFEGSGKEYQAAWDEYKALLAELTNTEDFYHVYFALSILPDLIIARQDIAQMIGQSRSKRRKPDYFKKGGVR